MVLITDDRDGGSSSSVRVKPLQQSPKAAAQVHPAIVEEPPSFSDDDYLGSCESEGEDDDFEEYDNFEDFPDTRSIVSDDSFYPPDDVFADSERSLSPDSPEPLSFFQACRTNNATIVRLMIRQGVREEEVREMDKNNRVGCVSYHYIISRLQCIFCICFIWPSTTQATQVCERVPVRNDAPPAAI